MILSSKQLLKALIRLCCSQTRGQYNPYHKTKILCHTNNKGKGQNTLSLSALFVVHSPLKYNVGGSYFAKCLPIGCRLKGFVLPNLGVKCQCQIYLKSD